MGTIKTTNIESISGSGTVTLGTSGETFALGSGVVQSNMLYPAFEAYLSGDQTIVSNTWTKASIDTEVYDSDSKFASNKFTPTVAGKYFVYGSAKLETDSSELQVAACSIYKNGSIYAERIADPRANPGLLFSVDVSSTIDMDADDYVELYIKIYKTGGTNIRATSSNKGTNFGAYRIGT